MNHSLQIDAFKKLAQNFLFLELQNDIIKSVYRVCQSIKNNTLTKLAFLHLQSKDSAGNPTVITYHSLNDNYVSPVDFDKLISVALSYLARQLHTELFSRICQVD